MNIQVKPTVSAEELERRCQGLQNARTSSRLEGLTASPGVRALQELWVTGQISDEEYRTSALDLIKAEAGAGPDEVSG